MLINKNARASGVARSTPGRRRAASRPALGRRLWARLTSATDLRGTTRGNEATRPRCRVVRPASQLSKVVDPTRSPSRCRMALAARGLRAIRLLTRAQPTSNGGSPRSRRSGGLRRRSCRAPVQRPASSSAISSPAAVGPSSTDIFACAVASWTAAVGDSSFVARQCSLDESVE